MTDQTARQRRGPVFKIPLTRWQRRQKHLQERPSNSRALIGFTPDGQAVVNPVQAELRRVFKGIVSRPTAARLEGIKNRNTSTHEPVDVTRVHGEQSNRLCSEAGRESRRVSLAERDERAAEYRGGLARKVAEIAAREATEASAKGAA